VIANALQTNLGLRAPPPHLGLPRLKKPCVVWFTGLSGAGKSTLAAALKETLPRPARRPRPATACSGCWRRAG